MTTHQKKERGQPPTRAYRTRREWLAFLKEVSKFHFNPLMPNKSGGAFSVCNKIVFIVLFTTGLDCNAKKTALCSSIRRYLNGSIIWLKYIHSPLTIMIDISLITNER